MLRTQHILAIIAVCVNCALLHSKLTQSLTEKIHKHLSSHIDSDPGSRSGLAGWFWLRVMHEAAVIWQLAWSWRVLGRRPQLLIVWLSLQGCLTVLTRWLSAFPGASDPRERKRTLCLSWPSLRSPAHHRLYPNLFLKGESSSLLSLKETRNRVHFLNSIKVFVETPLRCRRTSWCWTGRKGPLSQLCWLSVRWCSRLSRSIMFTYWDGFCKPFTIVQIQVIFITIYT